VKWGKEVSKEERSEIVKWGKEVSKEGVGEG
jgi:hypothetical protein